MKTIYKIQQKKPWFSKNVIGQSLKYKLYYFMQDPDRHHWLETKEKLERGFSPLILVGEIHQLHFGPPGRRPLTSQHT